MAGVVPVTIQQANPKQESSSGEEALVLPFCPIVLRLPPDVELTDNLLAELSSLNDTLRLEKNAEGELEILPPTFSSTGNQNSFLNRKLGNWAEEDGTGVVFDSNAGFTLPNGAVRAPDASWILRSRVAALSDEQRSGFWRIAPDFVIELRSSTDALESIQRKMAEYIANGVRLGWLIDPVDSRRRIYVYRPSADVQIVEAPDSLSGDPELPGFTLDLAPVWEPGF